jgi:hypothetical protein
MDQLFVQLYIKGKLDRVSLKSQKRAARVILDLNASARSVNMFKQLNWIPYYDDVKILEATTAYINALTVNL